MRRARSNEKEKVTRVKVRMKGRMKGNVRHSVVVPEERSWDRELDVRVRMTGWAGVARRYCRSRTRTKTGEDTEGEDRGAVRVFGWFVGLGRPRVIPRVVNLSSSFCFLFLFCFVLYSHYMLL